MGSYLGAAAKQLASLQLREMSDLGKHTYANRLGDDDSEWTAAEVEWMPPSSLAVLSYYLEHE